MTMRYAKLPSNRQLKVSREIRKQVSQLLLRGDIHPVLEEISISITDVKISPDLRMATVFFTHMCKKNIDVLEMLKALSPEIRHVLAGTMKLRIMPEIRFVYDESSDEFVKLDALLNKG